MAIAPELLAGAGDGAVAYADDDGVIRSRTDGSRLPRSVRAPRGSYMTRSGAVITPRRRRSDPSSSSPQPRPQATRSSTSTPRSTTGSSTSVPRLPNPPRYSSGGVISKLLVAGAAGLVTLEFMALLTGRSFGLNFPAAGAARPAGPKLSFTQRYQAAIADLQGTGHGG